MFISASLWGSLGCVMCALSYNFLRHDEAVLCTESRVGPIKLFWDCVAIGTLTMALTCKCNGVSATCWGSFTWPFNLLINALVWFCMCPEESVLRSPHIEALLDFNIPKCFSLGSSYVSILRRHTHFWEINVVFCNQMPLRIILQL